MPRKVAIHGPLVNEDMHRVLRVLAAERDVAIHDLIVELLGTHPLVRWRLDGDVKPAGGVKVNPEKEQ